MKMFEKFKQSMSTNEALCSRIIDRVLTSKTSNEIKKDFSSLLLKIHNDIYEEYLHEQNRSGQNVIDDEIKARAYSASDIFLLTSRAEAFGIVLLESISCGTPVIAFNVGGVSDIARNGITGLLCNAEDTDEFASSIAKIFDDDQLRNTMSSNCRKIAIKEYKSEYEAGKYIELFEELLSADKTLN